jgi:hypothetical protein
MVQRLRSEAGFGVIELVAAMAVLSIALLALLAGYDAAAISLHKSARETSASTVGTGQLELYRALPYGSIGLDQATLQTLGDPANPAYDALYAENSLLVGDSYPDPVTGVTIQEPSGVVNDVQLAGCGSAPQCLPVQEVTGGDGHRYRLETFVRDHDDIPGIRQTERVVTVVVRDAEVPSLPLLAQLTTAFDRGPTS